jgi:hypothetical protein
MISYLAALASTLDPEREHGCVLGGHSLKLLGHVWRIDLLFRLLVPCEDRQLIGLFQIKQLVHLLHELLQMKGALLNF